MLVYQRVYFGKVGFSWFFGQVNIKDRDFSLSGEFTIEHWGQQLGIVGYKFVVGGLEHEFVFSIIIMG